MYMMTESDVLLLAACLHPTTLPRRERGELINALRHYNSQSFERTIRELLTREGVTLHGDIHKYCNESAEVDDGFDTFSVTINWISDG